MSKSSTFDSVDALNRELEVDELHILAEAAHS
jgi:hypothetical protein